MAAFITDMNETRDRDSNGQGKPYKNSEVKVTISKFTKSLKIKVIILKYKYILKFNFTPSEIVGALSKKVVLLS